MAGADGLSGKQKTGDRRQKIGTYLEGFLIENFVVFVVNIKYFILELVILSRRLIMNPIILNPATES